MLTNNNLLTHSKKMVIKLKQKWNQVVGKRRNKKRFLYSLLMVFTLFGLHTRRPSRDGCRGKLSFFYTHLTNTNWIQLDTLSLFITQQMATQAQTLTRYTISALLHTVNKKIPWFHIPIINYNLQYIKIENVGIYFSYITLRHQINWVSMRLLTLLNCCVLHHTKMQDVLQNKHLFTITL